jgi:hypothetical protein
MYAQGFAGQDDGDSILKGTGWKADNENGQFVIYYGHWAFPTSSLVLTEDGDLKLPDLQTFADNTAAAALPTNTLYKTVTGELRIKV